MAQSPEVAGAADVPPMPTWPPAPDTVLTGTTVMLRVATEDDAPSLFTALDHDDVWRHVRGRPVDADGMAAIIREAPAQGRTMFLVSSVRQVRGLPEGAVIGSTSLFDGSVVDARCEIGFTWYRPEVWGSVVNPDAKHLLLRLCFEVLGMARVQLKTDLRNERSQSAISRLGATREGVLRRYQRRQDGTLRDTVMYSVLADEWPGVRSALQERLTGA